MAYTAMFTAIALGGGAIAIDVGQMVLLKTEMQNRADAGALAGARHLNGLDGARAQAEAVAISAMQDHSGVSGNAELSVADVTFYSSLDPLTEATNDLDADYIRVTLSTQNLTFFMAPVLGALTGNDRDDTDVDATALAGASPRVCNAPPLMICDFAEENADDDLTLAANVGRGIQLKEATGGGSNNWAPGNFGLLALPDGSKGASDIEDALAAVEPADCYDVNVETAGGSKTNKVIDGINARFDVTGNSWPYPAPNVIAYPQDYDMEADNTLKLGNGKWDIVEYWDDRHGGIIPTDLYPSPGDTTTDYSLDYATRYQTYLYELGKTYLKKDNQTVYPVPTDATEKAGYTSKGYSEVTSSFPEVDGDGVTTDPSSFPAGHGIPEADTGAGESTDDNDVDGMPSQTVASNGALRRVVIVAQLQCIADNIHGSGSYPTYGNYIEVFLTEPSEEPSGANGAAIYGEVLRALTAQNSPEYYANVRLLE